mmetsp:Transcript_106708/g.229734  ORF Transcript_106708/g.229734 Transcript_106708/m.229734 type:complete len:215 (-) Transcript_106708:233-877(-)
MNISAKSHGIPSTESDPTRSTRSGPSRPPRASRSATTTWRTLRWVCSSRCQASTPRCSPTCCSCRDYSATTTRSSRKNSRTRAHTSRISTAQCGRMRRAKAWRPTRSARPTPGCSDGSATPKTVASLTCPATCWPAATTRPRRFGSGNWCRPATNSRLKCWRFRRTPLIPSTRLLSSWSRWTDVLQTRNSHTASVSSTVTKCVTWLTSTSSTRK